MPNLLSIPFKKASELDIKQALHDHIRNTDTDAHPDAFKWDITHWATLRAEAVTPSVHVSQLDILLRYNAQLIFALTKLPPNVGLDVSYGCTFPGSPAQAMKNLLFERASVVFNLAALYSQLAANEDRSSSDGLKRALNFAQSGAGVLDYLVSSILPKFNSTLEHGQSIPPDLTESALKSMELLMLAQAQECVWQRAVLDNMKNGVIAKLAMKACLLYKESAQHLRDAPPGVKRVFPSNWLAHLEAKQLHFEAVAQFRKSMDDLESGRYGHELARLMQAKSATAKAVDVGRRGGVAAPVLRDARGFLDTLEKNFARAERDNDLIYHQDMPSASTLDPIAPASMVKSVTPPGLLDPQAVLAKGNEGVIFEELLSWGAREAINIYEDRRKNWLEEHVFALAHNLDAEASGTLQSLHLPAALDALDKPIGLPPSLLKKAEEVRLEDGPRRVEVMLADIQTLSKHVSSLLEESMDIIDDDVVEGDTSHQPLVTKYERYKGVLSEAANSDSLTTTAWEEWEERIIDLAQDQAVIEASVPSITGSATSVNRETKTQARALRRLLESLDDMQRERADTVRRAEQLADADDIRPRIAREAAGVARWTEITPAMFEDTMEDELRKFGKFERDVQRGVTQQREILQDLTKHHAAFLQSREEDSRVHQRQVALQSLDVAYNKYKEITSHLVEGHQFYNGLADIFTKFKQECSDWVEERRQAESVPQTTEAVSLPVEAQVQEAVLTSSSAPLRPIPVADIHVRAEAPLPSPPRTMPSLPAPPRTNPIRMPPPGSDDWEAVDVEAIMAKPTKTKKKKTKVAM